MLICHWECKKGNKTCILYERGRIGRAVSLGLDTIWVYYTHGRIEDKPLLGLPCGSAGKEFACNAGDLGLIPGLGRSPGEGKGYLLQYSGLEKSTDCIVHGVAKSRTQRNDSHFTLLGEWKCHM